jgi:hypothetical protein
MPSKPIVPLPSTLLRASAFAWPLLSTIFRFSDSHALEKQHSRWAMEEFPFRERHRRRSVRAGAGDDSAWDEAGLPIPMGSGTTEIGLGYSPKSFPQISVHST